MSDKTIDPRSVIASGDIIDLPWLENEKARILKYQNCDIAINKERYVLYYTDGYYNTNWRTTGDQIRFIKFSEENKNNCDHVFSGILNKSVCKKCGIKFSEKTIDSELK